VKLYRMSVPNNKCDSLHGKLVYQLENGAYLLVKRDDYAEITHEYGWHNCIDGWHPYHYFTVERVRL
jgi:hypothetical protein